MITNPRLGQRIQIWYGRQHRDAMPWHGRLGTLEIAGRARPRNHGIRIDGGPVVVVPAGNLRSLATSFASSPAPGA